MYNDNFKLQVHQPSHSKCNEHTVVKQWNILKEISKQYFCWLGTHAGLYREHHKFQEIKINEPMVVISKSVGSILLENNVLLHWEIFSHLYFVNLKISV